MTIYSPPAVLPLGVFGIVASQAAMARMAAELRAHAGEVSARERGPLADYLRGGRIVFAIMEHTEDVLGGSFRTPGGSAIQTDGIYYWRSDAADYVERYGIGLPIEFLGRARGLDWRAPDVSEERGLEIDRWLLTNARRVR